MKNTIFLGLFLVSANCFASSSEQSLKIYESFAVAETRHPSVPGTVVTEKSAGGLTCIKKIGSGNSVEITNDTTENKEERVSASCKLVIQNNSNFSFFGYLGTGVRVETQRTPGKVVETQTFEDVITCTSTRYFFQQPPAGPRFPCDPIPGHHCPVPVHPMPPHAPAPTFSCTISL